MDESAEPVTSWDWHEDEGYACECDCDCTHPAGSGGICNKCLTGAHQVYEEES